MGRERREHPEKKKSEMIFLTGPRLVGRTLLDKYNRRKKGKKNRIKSVKID